MCRVPDGMSSVVIWSMRQSRKTRSITAGPISFGTAAADPVGMLGHVAYLTALAVAGTWAGARTYRRRLYV